MQRLFAWRTRLRLRYLFLATFTLVTVLPAIALTVWVSMQALTREKQLTGEKQQHLAQIVAFGLDRYANDVRAAFEHMATLNSQTLDNFAIFRFARNLRFRYIALFDKDGGVRNFTDFEYSGSRRLDPRTLATVAAHATTETAFLPVMSDGSGEPTIFIAKAKPDGTVLAAALSNEHIRAAQRAVTFGVHGHAVIVDQLGQIIAHPRSDWEQSIKSLADIEPVQAILRGETGFKEFYAPGRDEQALAGFARSTEAGWGVITVRPMPEIEAIAWEFAFGSIVFVGLALLAAMVLAYAMARVIVRPVERVARVAQRLARGDLAAQVDPVPRVPAELGDLSRTINSLARNLNLWRLNMTESLQEAQASDQAKTNFLASLSHEIRTPLTAMIGFAEALRDQTFGLRSATKSREYASDIVSAGQHLNSLIDGILDLSQISEGQMALPAGPVSLQETTSAVAHLMQGQAERDKIQLLEEIPDDLPWVEAHEGRLKQALINLVSNAIKFTPQGGTVTISAERHDNGAVSIAIADTGIGMSSRDLDIALTPFGRVEKAWTRGRTGTGLGLPLARQFVEGMGGTFAIDSSPGYGTTVTLTFPSVALAEVA